MVTVSNDVLSGTLVSGGDIMNGRTLDQFRAKQKAKPKEPAETTPKRDTGDDTTRKG